jgi:hypothetical protein
VSKSDIVDGRSEKLEKSKEYKIDDLCVIENKIKKLYK